MSKLDEAPLSAEFVRSILDYNPETGIFKWRHREDCDAAWNARYAGTVAGVRVGGYIFITIGFPKRFGAHRVAWLCMTGSWPSNEVDHINRVRSDNRWANLRAATRSENARNLSRFRNNTTGAHGISYNAKRGKYQAAIKLDGKQAWFKRFDTLEEAIKAREEALRQLHGDFAAQNDG